MRHVQIIRARWKTTFGRWLKQFGTAELAEILGIDQHSVYNWVYGKSQPKLEEIDRMIKLSEGQISLKDIAEHKNIVLSLKSKAVAA